MQPCLTLPSMGSLHPQSWANHFFWGMASYSPAFPSRFERRIASICYGVGIFWVPFPVLHDVLPAADRPICIRSFNLRFFILSSCPSASHAGWLHYPLVSQDSGSKYRRTIRRASRAGILRVLIVFKVPKPKYRNFPGAPRTPDSLISLRCPQHRQRACPDHCP